MRPEKTSVKPRSASVGEKRPRTPRVNSKAYTITLPIEIHKTGVRLAKEQMRDFSNFLAVAIKEIDEYGMPSKKQNTTE